MVTFFVVGATGKGSYAGAAYLFRIDVNGSVNEVGKIIASDSASHDQFGTSVAIDGDFIVIGAVGENEKGSRAGAAYLYQKDANGNIVELAKIMASDGEYHDQFGMSVAISGDLIAVGVPYKDSSHGAVYIFQKDINGNVIQLQKLTASDGRNGDWFGCSVSINGNTIVAGAPLNDEKGEDTGAVYLFQKDTNGSVNERVKLMASDAKANSHFGTTVDISDTLIGISAPYKNENGIDGAGAVYLFPKDMNHDIEGWGKVTAYDIKSNSMFGKSLAVGKAYIVAGSQSSIYLFDSTPMDKVYIYGPENIMVDFPEEKTGNLYTINAASPNSSLNYTLDGVDSAYFLMSENNLTLPMALDFENPQDDSMDNTYQTEIILEDETGNQAMMHVDVNIFDMVVKEKAKLTASDEISFFNFGSSLAIDNNLIVIGAAEYNAGAAYLYQKNIDGSLNELGKMTASDGTENDQFGASVAVSGNLIVVGAPYEDEKGVRAGAVYLYQKDTDGNIIELAKIMASDGRYFDQFGTSVAISGNFILAGAPMEDEQGRAGAVYLFQIEDNGSVRQLEKITVASGSSFGRSLSASGDFFVVSSPNEDSVNGAVYLFQKDINGNVSQLQRVTASDSLWGEKFGYSVSISGDLFIVGAPYKKIGEKENEGAAYLFQKDINGNVSQLGKLTALDGESYDHFGTSVAVSGDFLVVGSPYENEKGSGAGSAYFFQKDIYGNVVKKGKLTASDTEEGDNFGMEVAISKDLIIVDAPHEDEKSPDAGAVYLYGNPPEL
ncbi:MAG: hypothetical protein ABXS92_02770 [Sulfurimonas sp.]